MSQHRGTLGIVNALLPGASLRSSPGHPRYSSPGRSVAAGLLSVAGVLAAVVLGLLLPLVPAWAQTSTDPGRRETPLGPFPPEVRHSAVISPDGRHIGWVQPADGQQSAVFDGVAEKPYDAVAALTFTPNSLWHAYAARSGTTWRIVVNGREQPAFERVGPPVFSPHSRRLAYTALGADGRVVVAEAPGAPGKPYEQVFELGPVFSPDSQHLAYGARRGDQWYLVLDGEEQGPFDFLGSATGIHFSPDSRRVAFGTLKDGKWRVVVDGRGGPLYDNLGQLAFSPDGSRLAYVAQQEGKWRVVLDGREQAPYETIGEDSLLMSPDSRHLAYAAQKADGKWRIVLDGEESEPYDDLGQMVFRPDGSLLACRVEKDGAEMVLMDGRAQRSFDRVGDGTLVFSADGRHFGYAARVGDASFVVIDGVRKPRYDMVGYLTFSPRADHYVYAATRGREAFIVVDEEEAEQAYDEIWTVPEARLIFDTPHRFHYLAIREGTILLIEEELD